MHNRDRGSAAGGEEMFIGIGKGESRDNRHPDGSLDTGVHVKWDLQQRRAS